MGLRPSWALLTAEHAISRSARHMRTPFVFVSYFFSAIFRYNHEPECGYEESELNFALHVRMGDRRELEGVTPEYFSLLEDFMATVTRAVVERKQVAPMFHVFSEALYPCPSPENATFQEFPFWPVERDQVSMTGQGLTLVLRTGRSVEQCYLGYL